MSKRTSVSLVSLGCSKNVVDAEVLLGTLARAGYAITTDDEAADVVLVNTCAFIDPAVEEARGIIEDLESRRKDGRLGVLVVTGCLPQRLRGEDLRRKFPWVDAFLGPGDVPRIASVLERCLARRRVCQVSPEPRWLYDHRSPRFRITLPHVAYVKIADGCSHACSFCMIPKLRGPFRSRRMGSVVEEIRALSADGRLKEVCLIAQDTTAYGRDLYGRPRLTDLLGKILREKRVPWVRLLYAYPRSFNGDLVDLMANEPALCRYVDLPLQHCNDRILKRMRRGTTKKATLQMLERLRDGVPGVTIRTTLMVGFPGETEREFRELFDFVATQRFDRLGLFSFSPQKGTPAAGYPAAVPEEVKQERYHAIMLLQQTISRERNRRRIGETVNVLVDGVDDGNGALLRGRSEADAPEIDGAVLIPGGRAKPGSFIRVRVTGATEYDLIGEEAGPA